LAHIALICPAFFSHLRAFEALGEALRAVGHEVTFLLPAGASAMVRRPGLAVAEVPLAAGYDPGAVIRRAARPRGLFGILRTVRDGALTTDALCREGPRLLRERGIQAVVGDELEPAAGLLARHLGVPFVSLAAALPIERDPTLPMPFLGWRYDPSRRGRIRNDGGEFVGGLLLRRQREVIRAWARAFALPHLENDVDCLSDHLRLTQTVAAFDFPRPASALRPVGPIRLPQAEHAASSPPAQRSRPFVFASLGTLQGHRFELFQAIAAACRDLDADLLVAHCGGLDPAQAARLDAGTVVDFADQMATLRRADACITHGGLNTVLDALAVGTPMLALPIAFDQPGVGARILHHRVGEALPAGWATRAGIRRRLERLFRDRIGYVAAAAPARSQIVRSGGAREAAALIDAHIRGGSRDPRLPAASWPVAPDGQTTHAASHRRSAG